MNWKLFGIIVMILVCIFIAINVFTGFSSSNKSYCKDLNEWCECFNGKFMCDLNVAIECDYLCATTTAEQRANVGAGYVRDRKRSLNNTKKGKK